MKQIIRDTKPFFLLFAFWLIIGLAIILGTDKPDLHIWINRWNHPAADVFFRYATHFGEGLFAAFVALLIFIYRIRLGVAAVASFILSGLITQGLKRLVFNDFHRPSRFFEQLADLHFVEGVVLHKSFSFPSGHTTAAFSIFFLLALITKWRSVQALCLVLALTVGFSRVYLSQHFFEDIYAGSIVGTGISLAIVSLLRNQHWGEQGLLDSFDTKRKRAG